jgi:two-component system LytT family response regulator
MIIIRAQLEEMSGFAVLDKIHLHPRPVIFFITQNDEDAAKAFEYQAYDYLIEPITSERIYLSLLKVKELMQYRKQENLQEKLNSLFRYIKFSEHNESKKLIQNNANHKAPMLWPIKVAGKIYFLNIKDIEYICASGYYIDIFANRKKHLFRQLINSIYDKLDQNKFIRIHCSVIIHLDFLAEINRRGTNDFSVKMKNGGIFKISKTYKKVFFALFDI